MNRYELRRLQKAARDKDMRKLGEWATQFENQVEAEIRRYYEKVYSDNINDSFSNLLIALLYSLYFSEETYIDKNNINDFMEDFLVTLNMYRTGEYTPDEFKEQLQQEGITLDPFDYTALYKETKQQYMKLLDEYIEKLDNLDKLNENTDSDM